MDVSGKIAIVTGGGSGIGLEFVKLLHAKKCNIVIGDLALTAGAEDFLKTIGSGSAKVLFKKTDVTVWKQLEELFEYAEKEFGVADIVCPGAGLFEPKWSNFWQDTEEQSYKTLLVNCEHPVKASRLGIRALLKAKKPGVIMHISSVAGQTLRLDLPIYCASKAFINHFVWSMAELEEHGNIRVMALAPGLVATPLWSVHNPEKMHQIDASFKWIQPIDIASAMLEMVEQSQYKGGDIVEVTAKDSKRKVGLFNDPGPFGSGPTKGAAQAIEPTVAGIIKNEQSV